jgi:transposase
MDNAPFHPPKKLKNPCRRHGMGLLFLPAYSPDYNPIEKSWANMKRALINNSNLRRCACRGLPVFWC